MVQDKIFKSFRRCDHKQAMPSSSKARGTLGWARSLIARTRMWRPCLEARPLCISGGGIGRAIDEIMLNKALFDLCKVPVLGVIINKVLPDKLDKIKSIVSKGLERKGIRLLGVIPGDWISLSAPTVAQIKERRLDLKVFSGEENLGAPEFMMPLSQPWSHII